MDMFNQKSDFLSYCNYVVQNSAECIWTYIIKTESEKFLTVLNWRKLVLIEISLTLEINYFNLFFQLYCKDSPGKMPHSNSL